MNEKKDRRYEKFYYILLIIVLIIGVIIRYWGLGDKSLWIDEIYSYIFSSQKTFLDSFINMIADFSPPIYYLILYLWIKLFGNTEFILRFPSFLTGISAIPVMYFSAKKFFNRQVALGATILTAFSPALLYYSQEARSYSLFILLSLITTFIWIELINKNTSDDKIFLKYTIFSLLTIFTHYWGLIMVFFQVLYLFILYRTEKTCIKNLYSDNFQSDKYFGGKGRSPFSSPPLLEEGVGGGDNYCQNLLRSSGNIFLTSIVFFVFQYSVMNKYNAVLNPALVGVTKLNPFLQAFNQIFYNNYIFFLLIIIFLLFNIKELKAFIINEITVNKLASPLIYLSYIIILPTVVFLIMNCKNSSLYLHSRYLIFTVTTTYILISYIIFSFEDNKKLIKTGFIFCLSCVFLGIYLFVPQKIDNRSFTYYNNPKQEWSEATKYITGISDKNSVIIIDRVEDFYAYYFKKLDKNINKFNIIVDRQIFYDKNINQKINNYRKKYKKVYIFSTSMLGVEKIQAIMKTVKCYHTEHKNFININFYECY